MAGSRSVNTSQESEAKAYHTVVRRGSLFRDLGKEVL